MRSPGCACPLSERGARARTRAGAHHPVQCTAARPRATRRTVPVPRWHARAHHRNVSDVRCQCMNVLWLPHRVPGRLSRAGQALVRNSRTRRRNTESKQGVQKQCLLSQPSAQSRGFIKLHVVKYCVGSICKNQAESRLVESCGTCAPWARTVGL